MTEVHVSRILTALTSKGFVLQETHHTMLWLEVAGKKTPIHTWISHGQRRVDDWLLGQMAKQLKITKKQFLALIDCSFSNAGYVQDDEGPRTCLRFQKSPESYTSTAYEGSKR
jgi:hypothetical protein